MFFRGTFKETATIKDLGGPVHWEALKGQERDEKQDVLIKKMLATLKHGNPRRVIMCEYWTPLKGITQGLQIQTGEMVEDIEVVTIVMNAHDNEDGQPLFQIMTP